MSENFRGFDEMFGTPGPAPSEPVSSEPADFGVSFGNTGGFDDTDTAPVALPGSPQFAAKISQMVAEADGVDQLQFSDQTDLNLEATHPDDQPADQPTVYDLPMPFVEAQEVQRAFKKMGIAPAQAQELVAWHQQREMQSVIDMRRETERQLTKEWGATGYQENIARAQRIATRLDSRLGGELMPLLQGSAGNDARVIKLLLKLGQMI
ncbi:hypothetical protein [Desulfopila aestuarii]|uniref:Uncharacterized protein n=1 Tax=Desulfopila aestuarii DSM 18488 TaxID=1121416 RepID=A0A1M7YFN6_9BACT|nr:hypothetical protein [Desulfopila aestuarii]SHO51401.1 hypothetical protein SAMN02745220_03987 [Desulfopila aestuarii DSM 18488]